MKESYVLYCATSSLEAVVIGANTKFRTEKKEKEQQS